MNTVLITGGTGLVGKALTKLLLSRGYRVIILTRQKEKTTSIPNLSYANWDVANKTIDAAIFTEVTHIVHLAGAGVADRRWTRKRKQEIVDSRVNSGALIVQSLKNIPNKVEAVISASAIGWYGADPVVPNPDPFIETDLPSDDFLGQTCKQWEASTKPVLELGKRLVHLRIGIVLSKEGGALKEFITPLKFGIAAILGSGKQIISWIHIDDLANLFVRTIENKEMTGIYNAVAPYPVSNKELTIALATARNKFYLPMPVPAFVLKLMLGEMSVEVLKSATVSADKVQFVDFQFKYALIKEAVTAETQS